MANCEITAMETAFSPNLQSSGDEVKLWTDEIANIVPVRLPIDHSRPSTLPTEYRSESVTLDSAIVTGLNRLIHSSSTNLFITIEAALKALIHRYYQQTNLTFVTNLESSSVGTTFISRSSQVTPDKPFDSLLSDIKENYFKLIRNELPETWKVLQIVALREPRSLNVHLNGHFDLTPFGSNLSKSNNDNLIGQRHYDLGVTISSGNQVKVTFNYDPLLFKSATIARFAAQFNILLSDIADNSSKALGDLAMTDSAELSVLRGFSRQLPSSQQSELTVLDLLKASITANSNRFAIKESKWIIGYPQLNAKANQMARFLSEKYMIPRGSFVAILLSPSVDSLISLLAIFKMGCVAVLLGPDQPSKRSRQILNDCDRPYILTNGRSLRKSGISYDKAVDLEATALEVAALSSAEFETLPGPDDLAVCLYTGQLSGRPKGVLLRHRSLAYMVQSCSTVSLSSSTRSCVVIDSGHSPFLFQCLATLTSGGLLIFPDSSDNNFDPVHLIEVFRSNKCNFTCLPSRIVKALLDLDLLVDYSFPLDIITYGEALRSVKLLPNVRLTNVYGCTELWPLTMEQINGSSDLQRPSLGKPVSGVEIDIQSQTGSSSSLGVVGEICFRSVAAGEPYVKGSSKTNSEEAANNQANETKEVTWTRTGDLGRWQPDGTIDFIGKIEGQMNVRGYPINLREIEDILIAHPSICQVAVTVEDDGQNPGLVAYIILAESNNERRSEILAKLPTILEDLLPRFIIPRITLVNGFQVDIFGRLDGSTFGQDRARNLSISERQIEASDANLQANLVAVWSKYLACSGRSVGLNDNFYQLGGDSLIAETIANELANEPYSYSVTGLMILKSPTIESLVTAIRSKPAFNDLMSKPLTVLQKRSNLSMSHQQRFTSILELGLDSKGMTCETFCLTLPFGTSPSDVEKAINLLVKRHEAFRLRFQESSQLHRQSSVSYTYERLTVVPVKSSEEAHELCYSMRKSLDRVFDGGDVVQFQLAQSPERLILLMALTGLITDHLSLKIFQDELITVLTAFTQQKSPDLPDLRINFLDYVAWEQEYLYSDKMLMANAEKYWIDRMRGSERIPMPSPRSGQIDSETNYQFIRFQGKTFERLESLARNQQTTMFILGKTILLSLLSRYTGQTDLTLQTCRICRNHPIAYRLIGNLTSLNYSRARWFGDPKFLELLQKVQTDELEESTYRYLPFARLCDLMMKDAIEFLPITYVRSIDIYENFDLVQRYLRSLERVDGIFAHLWSTTGQAAFGCVFNMKLFSPSLVTEFMDNLNALFDRILDSPDKTLSDYLIHPVPLKISSWNNSSNQA